MKRIKGKTNWNKVKSFTEKRVIAAAKSDPDAKPLTRAQLKKFKRSCGVIASAAKQSSPYKTFFVLYGT